MAAKNVHAMVSDQPAGRLHSRRTALAMLASSALFATAKPGAAAPPASSRGGPFSYDDVVEQARALGERAFDSEGLTIPPELSKLTYDSYREIRFRREKAFWRDGGSDYRLHPFHLGFLHDKPVQLHVIKDGSAIPLAFTTGLFEYGKVPVPKQLSPALGFAGFAVTTTLNALNVQDELIAFLGASYFRLIGRGHRYGLSARALALDVGGEQPEEFPFFRALWLEEPTRDSTDLVIYALLDSPSVAGAYRFVVTPGQQTSVAVTATIIPRVKLPRIGIAPLTSMFLAGEGDLGQRTDFRPEIHDSDGLMLKTGGGEWVWRPIRNPKSLRISSFGDNNPRGFGLMQRDREFGHYQDLEAQYHARPGYWVEPAGDWGEGRIDLIEIPTTGEAFDNIVACWTPSTPLEAQESQSVQLSHLGSLDDEGSAPLRAGPEQLRWLEHREWRSQRCRQEAFHRRLHGRRSRILSVRPQARRNRRIDHGRGDCRDDRRCEPGSERLPRHRRRDIARRRNRPTAHLPEIAIPHSDGNLDEFLVGAEGRGSAATSNRRQQGLIGETPLDWRGIWQPASGKDREPVPLHHSANSRMTLIRSDLPSKPMPGSSGITIWPFSTRTLSGNPP